MPYSITTRDGITIANIPDDLPHDDPSLRQRVAQIRAQGAATPGAPPAPVAAPPAPGATLPNGQPNFTAPTTGYVMGLRDPIDAGAQLLEHVLPDSVSTALNKSTNWLADRLPSVFAHVSETPDGTSKLVQEINKTYDAGRVQRATSLSNLVTGQPADPGFDWGRLAGNVINPVNAALPGSGSANTVRGLAMAGARAGAVAGALQPVLNDNNGQDFWTKKAEQAGVGAAAGGILTPAITRGAQAAAGGVQRVVGAVQARMTPPAVTQAHLQQAVQEALSAGGMSLQDAPQVILQSVTRQAQEALNAGQRLDPAAAMRRANFEAVGLTGEAGPTLGQLMRDPIQYANERNLVGVQLPGPNGIGNPLADRFQAQANRLQGVFDNAGATGATDRGTAGATLMDALRGADAPVQSEVTGLYNTARAMNNGRAAELERGTFSQAANRALDEGMLGHALPADIRSLLNSITSGETPFNVDAATQIDTLLSRAQRRVSSGQQPDLSAAEAIGRIRDALHATPLVGAETQGARATGSVGDAAMGQTGAPQLAGPIAAPAPIYRQPVTPMRTRAGDFDAKATEAALPPIPPGMTRLYRAESPTTGFSDVFNEQGLAGARRSDIPGQRYSSDIKAAEYYRRSYNGNGDASIHYIDVPNEVAGRGNIGGGEFKVDVDALNAGRAGRVAPSNGNQVSQILQNGAAPAAKAGIEDTGANARAAFDQARAAARNRFATIEDTPALKAALDDAAPDKFVQKYLIGADARDVQAMRNVLQNSPEALQQARAQIADTLKRAAFGNNASGDGGFAAERYLNTLRALGPEKLRVFFTPEEIVQFNTAGRVMSDITSIPAGARGAVNTSGTAGAIMNLFSKIAGKVPGARMISNQVGEIQTQRAMDRALAGQASIPNPGAQLPPQALSAIRLLFAPAAVGGGALGGQAAN